MKVAVVALLLLGLAAFASAFTTQEYKESFVSWTQKYQRAYTAEEFQTRFAIFMKNMDFVRDWNAKGDAHTVGLNHFADLSNEEYQRIYLGTHIDGTARLAAAQANPQPVSDNYNATIDWRAKGAVTPIKNQGQCGSCWSFSTTGSTEGAHFLATQKLVSLSEQNLMDCSRPQGNNGCEGGLMDQAFTYIIKNGGIDTEASYPYQGVDSKTCRYDPANSGATLSSFKDVTAGDESALATAVSQQPVSVAIDASHMSFQLYVTGIYHELFCSSSKLDHGVLAVGYGTDTSKSSNNQYWIVKNSWGTTWGQAGYIYMSKNRNNNCGIATSASYPIV